MSTNSDTPTGSNTAPTDHTEQALRERFPEIVVSTSSKSDKRLHIPDSDNVEPLCDVCLMSKSWTLKPVVVYPPGFREYCGRCREALREDDRQQSAAQASTAPE